jgi:hypothetical protein
MLQYLPDERKGIPSLVARPSVVPSRIIQGWFLNVLVLDQREQFQPLQFPKLLTHGEWLVAIQTTSDT